MSLYFPQGPKNIALKFGFCQFLYGFVATGLSHESIDKSIEHGLKFGLFHRLSLDLFGKQFLLLVKTMAGEGPFERLEAALGEDRAPWKCRNSVVTKKGGVT